MSAWNMWSDLAELEAERRSERERDDSLEQVFARARMLRGQRSAIGASSGPTSSSASKERA